MSFNHYTDSELLHMLASGPLKLSNSDAQRVIAMLRAPEPDRIAKFAILLALGLNPHDAGHFARELDRMPPKAAAELSVLAKRIGELESHERDTLPAPDISDTSRLASLLRIKECLGRFFTRFDTPLLTSDLDLVDALVEAEADK